ncbi:hypothetical protein ABBQ38_014010 [Trebouxia sp. C0009 RCD-2024]
MKYPIEILTCADARARGNGCCLPFLLDAAHGRQAISRLDSKPSFKDIASAVILFYNVAVMLTPSVRSDPVVRSQLLYKVQAWMPLQKLDTSNIKKMAMNQAVQQPAPLKRPDPPKVMEQPSQLQADKKVSARQSARMQKQQLQKQEEMEPICIDSDEDEHAPGSGPAREGDQNGAALATRHSTRSTRTQSTAQVFKGMRCVYPLGRKMDVVELTEHDLSRLDDNEFLNDTVIDFYAKWIQEHLDPEQQLKFHFFNTFFFKKLTEKSAPKKPTPTIIEALGREGTPDNDAGKPLTAGQRNHLRVKAWTKGVDIFSKDFLLIPIHDALHWSLIIVCHPGLDFDSSDRRPYILHLDSMEGSCHNLATISKALRAYLNYEWQRKLEEEDVSSVPAGWAQKHPGEKHIFGAETMPGKSAHVPRQEDYCNCGLFVLAYMDFWTHAPPDQVELCERGAWKGEVPYPAFLSRHWFQHQNASALRKHIRNLILQLFIDEGRLPADHPTTVNAAKDMAAYKANTVEAKYRSPADYLEDAKAADTKRKQEKARREERDRVLKEAKAAEAEQKQAEAKRLAGERAEERDRKRKLKQASQEDIEVDLSGGEDDLPDFVKDKVASLEDVKRRRSTTAAQGASQPDSEVQDLTAESPDNQGRRRLRSSSKANAGASSPGIAEELQVRRSKRKSRQTVESSDDDGDGQPATKRHLDLQASDQGKARSMSREPSSVDVTTVPDSQAELVEPGGSPPTQLQPLTEEQAPFFSRLPSFQMPTGRRVYSVQCSLSALTDGFVCKFTDGLRAVSGMQSMLEVFKQPRTQNASEDDHIRDAGLTADLIEEADRCQTPQGSVSGLDDDANLHGTSSQADDQIVTSDRMPGRLGDGTRTHEHHWPSALVLDPSDTADEALQLHGTASQQQHHEGMTEAQQARPAHQGFHHALQGQSPAQHSGYQTMNGHGSFKPGKIQDHFRRIGVGAKAVGELAAYADPLHPVVSVQDPSAVPGLSDDTDESREGSVPPRQPVSASISAAHESLGPSAATSPAPHQSYLDQPLPPSLRLKSISLDPSPQPLAGGGSHAQPGYLRRHADKPATSPSSPERRPIVLECTSPMQQPLPSTVLEAAAQGVSSGSALASPTALRRRAAKSVRMVDTTPLAAAAALAADSAAESAVLSASAVMANLPMMTVPDRPKAPRLSPPIGITASPRKVTKPAAAYWPADAEALHGHAEPQVTTSPGRPAAHMEAFRVPAAARANSQLVASAGISGDDTHSSRPVASFPNPFQMGLRHSSQTLSGGSSIKEFAHVNELGIAASEDDARCLMDQISGGLTDDQFQPGNRATDLFAMRSTQSMQAAEASGTRYASQLRQHNLLSPLEGQMLDEHAIDLCADDAMLEPAIPADSSERHAQILRDEKLAREMDMNDRAGLWHTTESKVRNDSDEEWRPEAQAMPGSTSGRRQAGHK